VDIVVDDLMHGHIGNFHVFKWRLAMALHGSLEEGVRLADIWDTWRAVVPEPEALTARLGWSREIMSTIDNYRDVKSRYTFPTLTEVRAAMSAAFIEVESFFPRYELGDRCPTLVFLPRKDGA
jgi:hypothetical protein